MNAIISNDPHGRTVVSAPGTSRRAIISRNGQNTYHFVPTVNHGETVVHGGRMFSTLYGAIRAARKFLAAA